MNIFLISKLVFYFGEMPDGTRHLETCEQFILASQRTILIIHLKPEGQCQLNLTVKEVQRTELVSHTSYVKAHMAVKDFHELSHTIVNQ